MTTDTIKVRTDIPKCDDIILAGNTRDFRGFTGAESINNEKNLKCKKMVEDFGEGDFDQKLKKYQDAIKEKLLIYSQETKGIVPKNLKTILDYETNAEKEEKVKKENEEKAKKTAEKEALIEERKRVENEIQKLEDANKNIINNKPNPNPSFMSKQLFMFNTAVVDPQTYETDNKGKFDANIENIRKLTHTYRTLTSKIDGTNILGNFPIKNWDGKNTLYSAIDENGNEVVVNTKGKGGKKYKKTRRPRKRSRKSAKKTLNLLFYN
jgi:hypothetical protein